jgi:peroxiredoxin
MSLHAGDRLPHATFRTLTSEGVKTLTTADVFAGRKVVLFAVPAAFSPTCSQVHLPGYVAHHDAIKAGGVDTIACVSANDVWVLDAWAREHGAAGKVLMLSHSWTMASSRRSRWTRSRGSPRRRLRHRSAICRAAARS